MVVKRGNFAVGVTGGKIHLASAIKTSPSVPGLPFLPGFGAVAESLPNKEIAHQLGVGVRNVETHRQRNHAQTRHPQHRWSD